MMLIWNKFSRKFDFYSSFFFGWFWLLIITSAKKLDKINRTINIPATGIPMAISLGKKNSCTICPTSTNGVTKTHVV